MVPTVQARRAEDPIERPGAQLHVRVLELAVHRGEDRVGQQRRAIGAEHDQRQQLEREQQEEIDHVEASRVEPVQTRRAVVRRVQRPHPRALVRDAVVRVVAELGGSTSHLASLARERGIPMVLGVLDATQRIPDGSQCAVDGVAGVVRWMQ